MAKNEESKKKIPEKAPATASTERTEPRAKARQTPVAPQPQAGTSQNPPPTPSVPLDIVTKLLQALIPGVNVEETLAQLITPSSTIPTLQTTTIPTPQPCPEPTPPKPDDTEENLETLSETEAEVEKEEAVGAVEAKAEREGDGEGEKVVEGKDITEREVVVGEKELRAERERELKTKVGEEARQVEGSVEKVSENEGDEDRKSASRETTEVMEKDEDDEEGSVGVGEEQRGTDRAGDDSEKGSEFFGIESKTEVVSEGDQQKNEEEGEVVNQEERRRKECKAVMRKSQVPYYRKIEELSRGITPTRRSNRIAGMFSKLGSGQEEGREKSKPMEISSDEQEEEEAPLVRKLRSTPVDQVTSKKEEEIAAVEKGKELEAPMQEDKLGEKEQSEAGTQEPEDEPDRNAAKGPAVNEEVVVTSQTGQDEDEDDEPPLKSRLRSSRTTDQVGDLAEEPKDSLPKAQPKASVLSESEEPGKEDIDEATYQLERKQKGKMLVQPDKKKVRRANTTVIIQAPIQVPFGRKDSKDEELTELEESSSGELYTMSKEIPNPNVNVSLVDEAESLE